MEIYRLVSKRKSEEYINLNREIEVLFRGCDYSEFQYLNHEPMECSVDENSGMKYPDFLQHGSIPLISSKFREILDSLHIDNLFYKPIIVNDELLGQRHQYYLALPPCIDCLDKNLSQFEVIAGNKYTTLPDLSIVKVIKPVIINESIGRYKIFKISGVTSSDIYVTEDVKKSVEGKDLSNVFFYRMEEV